jgi:ATP-dependent DNA ligase
MAKIRINKGQEFVIGGFIPGRHGVDSIIVGCYRGKDLVYVARVRNGFVPASRRRVFQKLRHLVSSKMPFVNLPDEHPSRWTSRCFVMPLKANPPLVVDADAALALTVASQGLEPVTR